VSIFRSRKRILLNPSVVAKNLYWCYDRRMRLWTKKIRHGKGEAAGLNPFADLIHVLDALRLAWKRCRHQGLPPREK
jgi:hypothetical protein